MRTRIVFGEPINTIRAHTPPTPQLQIADLPSGSVPFQTDPLLMIRNEVVLTGVSYLETIHSERLVAISYMCPADRPCFTRKPELICQRS
jgi:hypothetical protein